MQYVIFGNCLFPLSILPRRFSLLVPWIKKCFCLLLSIIPWYRYPTVWLTINTPKSSSIVSNLGLLGIKQLWIFIYRFFCELVFTDLGWMPKSKTTGSHGSPVFIFLFVFFFVVVVVVFIFWPHRVVCKILAPWPGIQPLPLQGEALEVQSLNHWTAREEPYV